jgi:hypothetical protein
MGLKRYEQIVKNGRQSIHEQFMLRSSSCKRMLAPLEVGKTAATVV